MKNNPTDLTLIHGDWLEMFTELPPSSVDLVVCDPPYEVTHRRWDRALPISPMWDGYEHVCKPDATIVLFAAQPFATALIASKPSWFRYDRIWVKNKPTSPLNVHRMPLPKHEIILIFRRHGSGVYNPQMTDGHAPMHAVRKGKHFGAGTYGSHHKTPTRGGTTKRYPTSVMLFDRVNNDDPQRIHPNQKPVPLLEDLIRTYSNVGDTVLDNTMGSGSAGLAAIHTGRNFIGVEKDPDYFDAAEGWLLPASSPHFCGWEQFDSILPPAISEN